jgi:replication factor C small subunit
MSENIPWVEKYRPRTLGEVAGHGDSIRRIEELTSDGSMPHFIFEGPAGTGKTSTAIALANDTLGDLPRAAFRNTVKELNASDARGINVVRTILKDFMAGKKDPRSPFKILILDEADDMTGPAMQALRRQMETRSHNCRLVLICNYSSKIIPPIQSRCAVVHFGPLSTSDIKERVREVAESEGLSLGDGAAAALAYTARGDMRRAINTLQAASLMGSAEVAPITPDEVYELSGMASRDDIRGVLEGAMSGDLARALDAVERMLNSGISGKEIASQIFAEAKEGGVSDEDRILISALSSDTIYNITVGCSERIQLRGLVAGIYTGKVNI